MTDKAIDALVYELYALTPEEIAWKRYNPGICYNEMSMALKSVSSNKEYNMNVKSYTIELPDSAFSALRKSPAEFIEEMKHAAVVKWYENGLISQDKAAEIAGLSRYEFLRLLSQYNVSAIQYTRAVLEEELSYAADEHRP